MRKYQIEYAVRRVKQIADSKLARPNMDKPVPNEFKRNAVLEGAARLVPSSEIIDEVQRRVKSSSKYMSPSAPLLSFVRTPPEYKLALKKWEDETKRVEKINKPILEKRDRIIDRLWMNEFTVGEDAIKEAEKITG